MGRLWRRAPAWRVCLVAALATTSLAAMFPPGMPGWVKRAVQPASRVAAAPAGASTAHFKPAGTVPDSGYSALWYPPAGSEHAGAVAFAGRELPLPAGRWQTLVLARGGKPVSGPIEVFGRVDAGEMTGLLMVAAPDPIEHPMSPFDATQTCDEPDSIANFVAPEPFGQGPLVHECWRLSALRGFDLAERGRLQPVLDRALLRLKETDARIPDQLVLLDYLRSDESGFLTALLFLPDRHTGARQTMVGWAKRYVALLHDAYDGVRNSKAVPADPG